MNILACTSVARSVVSELSRGPVKVTGRAAYAYEHGNDEPPLYGVIVTATIGHGRIREIYNLAFMKTAWVLDDIELLLKEK